MFLDPNTESTELIPHRELGKAVTYTCSTLQAASAPCARALARPAAAIVEKMVPEIRVNGSHVLLCCFPTLKQCAERCGAISQVFDKIAPVIKFGRHYLLESALESAQRLRRRGAKCAVYALGTPIIQNLPGNMLHGHLSLKHSNIALQLTICSTLDARFKS